MEKSRPDILQYPIGFIVLRIFQAVFSVIAIVCVALTVQAAVFAGNCLMIFTGSATFLITMLMLAAHFTMSHLYNFWSGVVLDGVLFIFWSASVAVLAAQTAILWAKGPDYCYTHLCTGPVANVRNLYGYVFAAACGLGLVEVVFFGIALIFHAVMSCRHLYKPVDKPTDYEPVQFHPNKHDVQTEYRPFS